MKIKIIQQKFINGDKGYDLFQEIMFSQLIVPP